jgi:hypothetical protein
MKEEKRVTRKKMNEKEPTKEKNERKHDDQVKGSVGIIPSSSVIVGIEGACEAGVGRVDAVAGVF